MSASSSVSAAFAARFRRHRRVLLMLDTDLPCSVALLVLVVVVALLVVALLVVVAKNLFSVGAGTKFEPPCRIP